MKNIAEMLTRLGQCDETFKELDERHNMLVRLAEENLEKMRDVTAERAELAREILEMTRIK